ncbi:hypothetical protein EDC01DRAFT_742721 [Geopyxis carbonaria]|nr:hypothetical protein EDC01DRAFT_742721 [Geopyxis carbonaria]
MSDLEDAHDVSMLDADPLNPNTHPLAADHHPYTTIKSEEEHEALYPNRPRNENPTLPFHELHQRLFEPLLDNSKKKAVGLHGPRRPGLPPHEVRTNIIAAFIKRWRTQVGPDIFPAFRLILPDTDRDRDVYHLKEKKLARLLIGVLQIHKTSDDAHGLLNWRDPGKWTASAGDFAGRAYEIVKKRPMRTEPGALTVAEVNDMLDTLSRTSLDAEQLPVWRRVYAEMCPEEMMWLVRIVLKQVKIGATSTTFFHAWHADAAALYSVSSSLRRVCWELWDPAVRVEAATRGVVLMSCFQPQLAQFQKKSLAGVVKAMGAPAAGFYCEEKLDGERMQMHYDGGEFRWWSRKAKEYTHLYGSGFANGSIARFMKEAFAKGLESVVLDGEMITWDPKADCIVAFGTLKTAAIETSNSPTNHDQHRPLFRVFDILYLNGQSIIDYDLETRRQALDAALTDVPRRFEVHPTQRLHTADDIEAQLRRVVATAGEGLVVKHPGAAYRLNDRNDSWLKVKPEYMTGFGESLDVLVVGGYWGGGRRGTVLSSYLCALRVDSADSDSPHFWSFCKVGGGFTAADYASIAHATQGKWHSWTASPPPTGLLELAGGARELERPDRWIHPADSFVVEIKAASVPPTDQFRTGCTLRFPRFKKLRPDRDWRSALSVDGFRALRAEAAAEAGERGMDVEVRGTKRVKRAFKVANGDAVPAFTSPPAAAAIFAGRSFYVMSDSLHPSCKATKSAIEATLKSHGGRIFQNESAARGITVLGDRRTVKIAALAAHDTVDILRPVWAFDCIAAGRVVPPEPARHILHALFHTAEKARGHVDRYGDPYYRLTSTEELAGVLAGIEIAADAEPDDALLDLLATAAGDGEGGDGLPGWMFRRCVVYVHAPSVAGCPGALVRWGGGEEVQELPAQGGVVTHVIVGDAAGEAEGVREWVQELRNRVAGWRGGLPVVVGERWVDVCIMEGTRVEEEGFVYR